MMLPRVGAAFLLALLVLGAAWAAEPAGDPLPKGAKVRFGVSRPILRTGPVVGLIPTGYSNFLAPTINGGVRRYDLGTGKPLDKRGVVGPGQVVVSADGKRAAVARPGLVTVVDVASRKLLLAVEPPEGVILAGAPGIALSATGKVLAYGGLGQDNKGTAVVHDVDKNEVLARVETIHSAPVYPALSHDGKMLVTHGPLPPTTQQMIASIHSALKPVPDSLRTAQVWEVATGKERFKARVSGMGGSVHAATFSPNGVLLACSAADGAIDLWDVKSGKRLQTLLGRKGQGLQLAFSTDSKKIASIAADYRIQRWTVEGKEIDTSDPPYGLTVAPVTGLVFADKDRVIAWHTAHQLAVAWEAPSGKLLSPILEHAAAIHSIALSAREKVAYTSGRDARVIRWGLESGQLSETIMVRPPRLPFRPLIQPVLTLSADATLGVWSAAPAEVYSIATGEDLFCVPPPSSPPTAVSVGVSNDGEKLLMISRQAPGKRTGLCVLWNLTTRKRVARFDIPPTANTSAPWAGLSPSGNRLAVVAVAQDPGGGAMIVVVGYDVKTGKKISEVKDRSITGSISMAAVSDETLVAVSNTGRVWSINYSEGRVEKDIETEIGRWDSTSGRQVTISPDGKRLAIGVVSQPFTTYGVRIYDWPKRKALHTFVGHAGPVTALRFSADSKYLATGSEDTSVLLWDLSKMPGNDSR
jgi:WD40 repeat protein